LPPARTENFANLVAPGLRKVWFDVFKKAQNERDVLFNVINSDRQYEETAKVGELPSAVEKPEGTAISYVHASISALKRITQVPYGLGFRITREMYDFDLYGPMKKMSKQLAESARDRMEIVSMSILNNAFSTSYGGFVSTESLCSTTHALLAGGTASNRPATDVDFSLSALQAACDAMSGNLNEVSMPRPINPRLLVGDYRYRWAFVEQLESEYKPYTANNEINSIRDQDLKYFLSHRFTDTDQWFLMGPKEDLGLWVIISKAPTFESGDDFDTGDAKFKTYFRIAAGYDEWRGVYGSSGG